MRAPAAAGRAWADAVRWRPGDPTGHYESCFLRGNHPARPLAFWLRYTVFSPRRRPQEAQAELWAAFFDGETGRHLALRQAFPAAGSRFGPGGLPVDIGTARLDAGAARGRVEGDAGSLAWSLVWEEREPPLLLLPRRLYDGGFPKAKSLVAAPLVSFRGQLTVGGVGLAVDGWRGSRNHNWGERHTHRYAWGQVAGFDEAPESFLEVATARLRAGGLDLPPLTPIVLRHRGREHRLNGVLASLRAGAELPAAAAAGVQRWTFRGAAGGLVLAGEIRVAAADFVRLLYRDPPGGEKLCLNSKIAACRLHLAGPAAGGDETLTSACGAAFELLESA